MLIALSQRIALKRLGVGRTQIEVTNSFETGLRRRFDEQRVDMQLARRLSPASDLELFVYNVAQLEAFAPLNGLVERSPLRPILPDATAADALGEEARKELDVARKLIAECGYHRRDEELAELDAVVASGRRFADLPPRV